MHSALLFNPSVNTSDSTFVRHFVKALKAYYTLPFFFLHNVYVIKTETKIQKEIDINKHTIVY